MAWEEEVERGNKLDCRENIGIFSRYFSVYRAMIDCSVMFQKRRYGDGDQPLFSGIRFRTCLLLVIFFIQNDESSICLIHVVVILLISISLSSPLVLDLMTIYAPTVQGQSSFAQSLTLNKLVCLSDSLSLTFADDLMTLVKFFFVSFNLVGGRRDMQQKRWWYSLSIEWRLFFSLSPNERYWRTSPFVVKGIFMSHLLIVRSFPRPVILC